MSDKSKIIALLNNAIEKYLFYNPSKKDSPFLDEINSWKNRVIYDENYFPGFDCLVDYLSILEKYKIQDKEFHEVANALYKLAL